MSQGRDFLNDPEPEIEEQEPNFDEYVLRFTMTEDTLNGESDDPWENKVSILYKLLTVLVILGRRLPVGPRTLLKEAILKHISTWVEVE